MKYNLGIPGWMSITDLEILNRLASWVPENGNILEVGSFTGRSTLALFYGKPASAKLEIVDTFEITSNHPMWIDEYRELDGDESKIQTIKQIAEETGSWFEAFKYCVTPEIFDQLTVNINTSNDYKITKQFDMVFVDANHEVDHVLHDIKKFASKDTLLVGDDFNPRHTGISEALAKVRFEIPHTLVVPANSKIWIMFPPTGYWRKLFNQTLWTADLINRHVRERAA